MNQKKTGLILVLAFVLLLGGASVLYAKLGSNYAPDQLAVNEPQKTETLSGAEEDETAENKEENSMQNTNAQTDTEEEADTEDTAAEPSVPLAPDFTVFDKDANRIHLSDYVGKPIVLNFWASWCGPCKQEMPDFHEKYLELEGQVEFLMINMTDSSRETMETASIFIEEQGYTFPVFFDIISDAAKTYGVYALPTTFFIDADGYIQGQATGSISANTLQRGIDMIYTEK